MICLFLFNFFLNTSLNLDLHYFFTWDHNINAINNSNTAIITMHPGRQRGGRGRNGWRQG